MGKLWSAISNFIRGKRDEAAERLADPARDATFAIEDSKKMADGFQRQIAEAMASTKRLEIQKKEAGEEVKKWDKVAIRAAEAGDREAAKTALEKKNEFATRVKVLDTDIKSNHIQETKFRDQLDKIRSKISKAEADKEMLKARLASGKTRQALRQASSDFNSNSPLAALDHLSAAACQAETLADAHEELSGNDEDELLDKYGSGSSDVEDELEKLMAKAKK